MSFIFRVIVITRRSYFVDVTYQGVIIDKVLVIAEDEIKNGPDYYGKTSNHTENMVESIYCPRMLVLDARLSQSLSKDWTARSLLKPCLLLFLDLVIVIALACERC